AAGGAAQPGVAAGGAVPTRTPYGVRELGDALEVCPFDPLYDKLRDPVTARDLRRRIPIVVDEVDQDLAAVAGVDRTRGVEHRHTQPAGQPRPRMHQPDVPLRQGDGDARTHQRAGAGGELDVLGRDQVGTGVARVG